MLALLLSDEGLLPGLQTAALSLYTFTWQREGRERERMYFSCLSFHKDTNPTMGAPTS